MAQVARRPSLAPVASALLAFAGAACVAAPAASPADPPTAAPGTPTAAPSTPMATPAAATSPPADDEFGRLVRAVAGDASAGGGELDVLWREILGQATAAGQIRYEAPARVVGYRGGEEVPDTECAIGTGVRDWRQNARYCPADQSILFDELWLREFEASAGPYAPVAILAHEWGHHVQHMLGQQIFAELQADCLAGIYLGTSEHVVGDVYELRDAELTAALTAFFSIGDRDYRESEWFQVSSTGSQQQRLLAFATGYLGSLGAVGEFGPLVNGFPWCYGYGDFVPADFTSIGPYRLINLPGRVEEWRGALYTIAPETRTAYETSGMRLTWIGDVPAGTPATVELIDDLGRRQMPSLELLYDPVDVSDSVPNGLAHYFEHRYLLGDGSAAIESGLVSVVLPATRAGALVIVVKRDQPAPTDPPDRDKLAIILEQIVALNQLLTRLCGPDDSADAGDPALNTSCLDEH